MKQSPLAPAGLWKAGSHMNWGQMRNAALARSAITEAQAE
jgi:hypothetical protein